MKKNLTEMVFIIDRSGSMSGLEKDTVGGFNSMLQTQKKIEGRALVSTVFFADNSTMIHDRIEIEKVPDLTEQDYIPYGYTALIDAIGSTVDHIENIHKYAREEDVPEHTVFVITTDGLENASHCYSVHQVRNMIERCKKEKGWEFIFLGANIDAVETAKQFGIREDRAVNYHSDSIGTQLNYKTVSDALSDVRCCKPLGTQWKAPIEKDFMERGRRKKEKK